MLLIARLLAPETASPNEESRELMAQLCGASGWGDLVAQHDNARQSISALWKKVKDGA